MKFAGLAQFLQTRHHAVEALFQHSEFNIMNKSLSKRIGRKRSVQLAKAVGFALATLTTSSAFAVAITASVPYVSTPPFPAFFDLNATNPTKSASWQTTPTSTPWTRYYAFQIISPAAALSVTASSTGSAIPGFSGNVYFNPTCDTWGGASDYSLSCTSTGTLLGAMNVTTAGLRLDLPASQPGYVGVTPPITILVEIMGTTLQAFSVNVNTEVPAPAALGLLGIGLMGMGLTRRRKDAVPA